MRELTFPRDLLPPGARLVLEEAADEPAPGPRSHLGDGRRVVLVGAPAGWAVDAEVRRDPPPAALARRFGTADFWGRWTRAECAAKLTRTPVATWLARHGLDDPAPSDLELVTSLTDDGRLTVSLGRARHESFTGLA